MYSCIVHFAIAVCVRRSIYLQVLKYSDAAVAELLDAARTQAAAHAKQKVCASHMYGKGRHTFERSQLCKEAALFRLFPCRVTWRQPAFVSR